MATDARRAEELEPSAQRHLDGLNWLVIQAIKCSSYVAPLNISNE
jgi:hypothetical protein